MIGAKIKHKRLKTEIEDDKTYADNQDFLYHSTIQALDNNRINIEDVPKKLQEYNNLVILAIKRGVINEKGEIIPENAKPMTSSPTKSVG